MPIVQRPTDEQAEALVSELVRAMARPDALPAEALALGPLLGATIGRYLLLEQIGAGGMGVVFAAYDPKLERKVALKFVRPGGEGAKGAAQERLLREAQAIAQLSHPNVVHVYDVGAIDDQVFLAMELVEGRTLAAWLSSKPRSEREVLHTFLEAGRGLAAAHAAGLIHRDFKPDNVLVGQDGRARVVDFGLARMPSAAESTPGPTPSARAGTPAYMAPEQRDGVVDARSDQYSFCVALYEALHGRLPGEPPRAGERRVATWLDERLRRGMSERPDERYPSMEALIEALQSDPRQALRRRALMAAALALIGVAALGARELVDRRAARCAGADKLLAGIWDGPRREAMRAAFTVSKKPFAGHAFTRTAEALDAYARGWTAMRTEACQATRVRGEQSEELLDLRIACLSHAAEELKTLVAMLGGADEALIARSVEAAQSLVPLERCARVAALRAPIAPPADAAVRARIEEVRRSLDASHVLQIAARTAEAQKLAQAAVADADRIGYAPLQAEALHQLGMTSADSAVSDDSVRLLRQALARAIAGRHDSAAAEIAVDLSAVLRDASGELGRSAEAVQYASAFLERLGGDALLEARLEYYLAVQAMKAEQFPAMLEHARRSLRLHEKLPGQERWVAFALDLIALALGHLGQLEESVATGNRSQAMVEELLGPSHPLVAFGYLNSADALVELGRIDEAAGLQRRAIAILEANDPTNSAIAVPFCNLAEMAVRQKKFDEAVKLAGQALDIAVRAHRVSLQAYALGLLAEAHLGQGDARRAIARAEEAIALEPDQPGKPAGHHQATLRFLLARSLWDGRRAERDRARQLALQARRELSALGDAAKKDLADVDGWLAQR